MCPECLTEIGREEEANKLIKKGTVCKKCGLGLTVNNIVRV